jgi:amine acid ABC transporter, permease protein, 3-TM region, His/Glu/Gln/Arg/opine family
MVSTLNIIIQYKEALLRGLLVTLELCFIIWIIGIIVGILLGYLASKFKNGIGIPVRVVFFILGGIPILVLLFWFYYPAQTIFQVNIPPFWVTIFVLSVIDIFYVADLVRNALVNFPNEYKLAAKVCGLSPKETFLKIEFPIIFRQIIPGLLNIQVNILQLTIFASLISVEEIFKVAQEINSQIYQPVEIYSTLAVFFIVICLPLNGVAMWLKYKFTRDTSEF